MSKSKVEPIPAGFIPLPTGLGFNDLLQPIYRRIEDGCVSLGLRVEKHHCNLMGICHGGVLMTLADITASSGVNIVVGKKAGSPTINMSMDFISAARIGQWIQADISQTAVKRRFGFCSGTINNSDGIVARFNGTHYLPEHDGMWKVEKTEGGILGK